jgi:hypothetical protein
MTLGLAALGSTLTPATALPSKHPGSLSMRPASLPAQKAPSASMHPVSATIHVSKVAQSASMHPASEVIKVPQITQTGATAPGASTQLGGAATKVPQITQTGATAPGAGIYNPKIPAPGKIGGGVDNVCPDNKFKCPPKPPAGPGTAGNPTQGPGSTLPMPGGPIYQPGNTGPVVIVASPPVYQAPGTVVAATNAPAVVTTTNAPAVVTAPCNCLTKQYLSDGSVLFQDICTKEAAMATPDELKAQAQAAPAVR